MDSKVSSCAFAAQFLSRTILLTAYAFKFIAKSGSVDTALESGSQAPVSLPLQLRHTSVVFIVLQYMMHCMASRTVERFQALPILGLVTKGSLFHAISVQSNEWIV